MNKFQQWLLFLVSFLFANTLYAQININIDINGVSNEIETNIRHYLSIEQQKEHALLSQGLLQHFHKKAPQEITLALQPYGYYKAEIKSELTQLSDQQWRAIYTVKPGPALPISELNITLTGEINNDIAFKNLIKKHSLHKHETFNNIKYEDLKRKLINLAAERGYFNAYFIEHRVDINLKSYDAKIHLNYDGSSRYRFGEVRLTQNVLTPELLRRYIPFKQGTFYSLKKLIDLQQALNDSDYFTTVEVSPGQLQAGNYEVPIIVKLTPRKPNRYSVGMGYGTDTGARARFSWEKPRLNKNGHRMNTEAKVSEIGYSMGVQYRLPVLNPRTDQIIYSTAVVNEKTTTSDSTISTIGVSLNRSLKHWRQSVALNYQLEEFVVANDQGSSDLLMPSINLSRTWGRNHIYTLDGLRFDIGLRGASEQLLSNNSFSQLQGGLKAITSLGKSHRIIARGRLGGTWTDNFRELPSSVRFFAGGTQSVRGYSYQSLGPTDSSGKVVGGRYLMIASLEYEKRLNGKWGAAFFYDAGNAFNALEDKLEHGAGFGIRWNSPIGPVRFDFASAISRPGMPWRVHINIGPDL